MREKRLGARMSKREFIKVSVTGLSTPKGKRKPMRYLEEIMNMNLGEPIDEAKIIELAKTYLEGKHRVESARIIFNKAFEEGEMVFVTLLPFKTIEIMGEIE